MFLVASLGAESVYRFFIVLAVVTALYLVYGIHAAAHHDRLVDSFTARCSYFCPLPDACLKALLLPHDVRGSCLPGIVTHHVLMQRRNGAVSSMCGCT